MNSTQIERQRNKTDLQRFIYLFSELIFIETKIVAL
jgi:hypothetical protein